MARIAGVDLPREKKVEIGLTYIFGIGRATARRILVAASASAADASPWGAASPKEKTAPSAPRSQ